MLNVVYSVIDMFSDYGNQIIRMIYSSTFEQVRLGYSSALAVLYFAMIAAVLVVIFFITKRFILKQDN